MHITLEFSKDFKSLLKGQGVWAEGIQGNWAKRLDLRGHTQPLSVFGDDACVGSGYRDD